MVVRISDKTQNYSKVTKLLVKPIILDILRQEKIMIGLSMMEFKQVLQKARHPITINI